MRQGWYPRIACVAFACAIAFNSTFAQEPKSDLDKAPKPVEQNNPKQTRERQVVDKKARNASTASDPSKSDARREPLRREDESEGEASIVAYVNSFFTTTRLGPEDVITVDVFDQPNYSRTN